jgi:tetratricopeptide (TPR) repeat protein
VSGWRERWCEAWKALEDPGDRAGARTRVPGRARTISALQRLVVLLMHPNRAKSCASLAVSLHTRYKQTGDVALLDEAINLEREALSLQSPGHPDRANSCVGLAVSLHTRYEQTGDITLLDEAIGLAREALALRPLGHPERASSCDNLAVSLQARYKQTGDITLLDEAIKLKREALSLLPLGNPNRSYGCSHLAISLHTRYKQTGDIILLDEAIELKREALSLRPPGHPDRAFSCANLTASLHTRYELTGDVALLDEAIETCIYATKHSSASQVWYPLIQLSRLYLFNSPHYSVLLGLEYLQQSFQHEVDATHHFTSEVCYIAALVWDDSGVWSPHTTTMFVDVYVKIVGQLPLVAGFVLDTSSRLKTLKSTRQVGSDACVAASLAEQPATAVSLLDRAHGVVWTQALHQRDPQMEGAPKELAIELEGLLRTIATSAPVDSTRLPDQTQDLRHRQNARIQVILREIRAMPGLARFMLGSTYETLREAARNHPVVALVATRGHAFAIVMRSAVENEPHALHLDFTSDDLLSLRGSVEQAGLRSRADTRDGHTDARLLVKISKMNPHHQPLRVLADIWRKVVKPVIDYLGLEVCGDKNHRCSTADTSQTEGYGSVAAPSALVCQRRLRLPPNTRCRHVHGTAIQPGVLFGFRCLVVHPDDLGTTPCTELSRSNRIRGRQDAPRGRGLCHEPEHEQTMERPERAGVYRGYGDREAVWTHGRGHPQGSYGGASEWSRQAGQLRPPCMPRHSASDQCTRERLLPARRHADDLEVDGAQARPAVVRVPLRLRDGQGRRRTAGPSDAPCSSDAVRWLQVRGCDNVVSRPPQVCGDDESDAVT